MRTSFAPRAGAGSRWFELTHHRFIAPILASNQRWRSTTGRSPITAAAEEWQRLGQAPGRLLRGVALSDAVECHDDKPLEVDDLERTLLNASEAAKSTELRASRRRMIALTGAMTLITIVMAVFAVEARQQSLKARDNEITALAAAVGNLNDEVDSVTTTTTTAPSTSPTAPTHLSPRHLSMTRSEPRGSGSRTCRIYSMMTQQPRGGPNDIAIRSAVSKLAWGRPSRSAAFLGP